MAIQFTCPHCNAAASVDDKYAGATGPCRSCNQTITIPGVAPNPFTVESPIADVQSPAAAVYSPPQKSSFPWVPVLAGCGFVSLLLIGLLIALLLPAVSAARQAARSAQCQNQQKQITLAMLNYESARRRLPPAHSVGADGKPMHSWRVMILPYLGEQALYERFKLDEPWDSPHNLDVAKDMPEIYRCPADSTPDDTNTNYMVVCDPNSAFPATANGRGLKLKEIADGTSKTVGCVEVSELEVHWSEPRDLSLNELSKIGSEHRGANVTFLDGSVIRTDQVTPSMVIRNDGQ